MDAQVEYWKKEGKFMPFNVKYTSKTGKETSGRWLSYQREQAGKLKKGEKSQMTDERLAKLDSRLPGWINWSKEEKPLGSWDEQWEIHMDYKKTHGKLFMKQDDKRIPHPNKNVWTTGSWLNNQRGAARKWKKEGKKERGMDEDKYEKIEELCGEGWIEKEEEEKNKKPNRPLGSDRDWETVIRFRYVWLFGW